MCDLNLEHGAGSLLPQIHALGRAAGQRVGLPRGFSAQAAQNGIRPRYVKYRREAVNQPVARLVRADQPQRHPVRARVEIEEASFQDLF